MNKRVWIIIGLFAFIVFIGGAKLLYDNFGSKYEADNLAETEQQAENENENNETEQEKIVAPDFTVVDMDGNSVKLSDFRGKPVVVNFWASWCGPCKMEMPDFNDVYHEYGDDVVFMMVNMTDGGQETLESAKKFINSQPYDFPVYFDVNMEAAIGYGVSAIPMTFFIDDEGNVVTYALSMLDAATLVKVIEMILE